jgi:hypothetical protein
VIAAGLQFILALSGAWGVVATSPTHVIFAFVDHFEPTMALPDPEVTMWIDDYKAMADRHMDADGRHPIHSYFLICEPGITTERLDATLARLNHVAYSGFGEVELHLHHGLIDESVRTQEEATTDFLNILSKAKTQYNARGALLTAEPSPKCTFGFIHGMWALDDSRLEWWPGSPTPHRAYCGVNRELDLLKQNGCYADFTFPAWGTMEPSVEASIFYATDDDGPASYKTPSNIHYVEVDQPPRDELMIIEGPYGNANIGVLPGNYNDWPGLFRMRDWVGQRVHVLGKGDWIFVKVHTHGCAGDLTMPALWDCFFGLAMDTFYSEIENTYNDGRAWKLHYVSAREMYNIVKAAEAGMTGDPADYRDFLIPPYANMRIFSPDQYRLISYDANEVVIERTEPTRFVDVSLKQFTVDSIIFEEEHLGGSSELSDAAKLVGDNGELHLIDGTPSRYYRIVSPAKAAAEGFVSEASADSFSPEGSADEITSGPDDGI